jgi:signal transduction histidine kinase
MARVWTINMNTGADTSRVAAQAAAGGLGNSGAQNSGPSSAPGAPNCPDPGSNPEPSQPTRNPERRQQQAKKVLIIDDTPDIRMIIAESLSLFGFETLTAEDGLSGVQLAEQELPDLVICDITMPKLDGYGTLKAMREREATSGIPFIFLTGATEKSDIRRGMELGADDYLTKPFSHKELMAAVNARLEKQAEVRRQSDKRLNELRGNITLALPHELRTPLNGIMGLAQIMMEDYASMPPAEVLESSRFIHDSALRLNRLIENFLVYSQIELMASESKVIDISSAVKPLVVQERVPEIARKVAARHKREGDLLLKMANAILLMPTENLTKIVEELADNAFKFSEPGKPVLVAAGVDGNLCHLTFTDKGRGMTPEQLSHIGPHMQFERRIFEQQGAGLGLVIAKRLTELLGGQFHVESKVGQGTTVKVSFATPGI